MSQKRNSFVVGAFIIAISSLLVKLIGAIYKIPLDRFILQTAGNGIYSSSYTIYNLLFVISTAGLPVAISKMIAEATAKNQFNKAQRIFKVSKYLLFVLGLIAFVVMYIFAPDFAKLIGSKDAYLTMKVMAPSLFFVSIASSYRGYYQGMQNMMPTAISEVIEAMSKLVFGLSIAYIVKLRYNTYYISSAGAISGITIGTFLSLSFLFLYHLFKKPKTKISIQEFNHIDDNESYSSILKRLVKIAIPITIGVSVFTLTSLIDTATVMNTLTKLGYGEEPRASLYGYLNRAITLFNMPPTIINAIAISIVPTVASYIAIGNKKTAAKNTISALKIALIVALPCAIGLSILAEPILMLLYGDPNHSFLLTIMGLAVLLVTMVQISNAILQSWGKVWIPVANMFVGGIVKVVFNLYLVSIPQININGAPIGTFMCYLTVMVLNVICLKKSTNIKFKFSDFIIKPTFCAIITAFVSYFSYALIKNVLPLTVSLFITITITAIVYFLSMFMVKWIGEDEILLLPKGDKIISKLAKFHLI